MNKAMLKLTVSPLFAGCILIALAACNQQPSEPEPVDEALTEELNSKFEAQLLDLTTIITDQRESGQGDLLEQLAEGDRGTLIDETITDQEDKQAENTEKVLKAIESAIQ